MNLHEALQDGRVLNGDMWFLPVSWKGKGQSYCITGGMTQLVPTLYGGEYSMTCGAKDLAGDWEIVSPDDVLDGK